MGTDLPSFSFGPQPVVDVLPQTRSVGGFWRRFLAFAADALILGVVGFSVGAVAYDELSKLGPWGRLVGFFIALVYFAVLDSWIGDGQTIGKRWLGLRVVDGEGNTIPFGKSLARYTIFAVPYFLNGLALPMTRTPWIVVVLLGAIVFGVGGGILYLLIFNRSTRQGLHDLVVESYVAKADETGALDSKPVWKAHWAVLGTIVVLSIATGILGNKMTEMGRFPELLQDLRLVEQLDGVQRGGAFVSTFHSFNGGWTKTTLRINVSLRVVPQEPRVLADQVAMLILQNDKDVQRYDQLSIVLIRGYDIGISSGWKSEAFANTPAEWNQQLFGVSQAPGSTQTKQ